MAESHIASRVVGICINSTPLKIELATYPAKSPITPPPKAIMQSFLSIFCLSNSFKIYSKVFIFLYFSPSFMIITFSRENLYINSGYNLAIV